MLPLFFLYLIWIAMLSLLGFVVYGWDKRQARRNGRRVPESRLHAIALLGGWPGTWLGQSVFRHKTQKAAFRRVFILSAIVHLSIIGLIVFGKLRVTT